MQKEISYISFLRKKIINYDNLPRWEQKLIYKANKIDYNMYLMRLSL